MATRGSTRVLCIPHSVKSCHLSLLQLIVVVLWSSGSCLLSVMTVLSSKPVVMSVAYNDKSVFMSGLSCMVMLNIKIFSAVTCVLFHYFQCDMHFWELFLLHKYRSASVANAVSLCFKMSFIMFFNHIKLHLATWLYHFCLQSQLNGNV
jgi:hypothetical protein